MGNDPGTRTNASTVTWSDGNAAISISCDAPGGCQSRAVAICKGPNYTALSMENMPTRGDMTMRARTGFGRHPLRLIGAPRNRQSSGCASIPQRAASSGCERAASAPDGSAASWLAIQAAMSAATILPSLSRISR